MRRKTHRRRKTTIRGAGIKHVKEALKRRTMKSVKRVGKHIFNQELGKIFLVPGLRPNYATKSQLLKNEVRSAMREFRKKPLAHIKHAFNLLRK